MQLNEILNAFKNQDTTLALTALITAKGSNTTPAQFTQLLEKHKQDLGLTGDIPVLTHDDCNELRQTAFSTIQQQADQALKKSQEQETNAQDVLAKKQAAVDTLSAQANTTQQAVAQAKITVSTAKKQTSMARAELATAKTQLADTTQKAQALSNELTQTKETLATLKTSLAHNTKQLATNSRDVENMKLLLDAPVPIDVSSDKQKIERNLHAFIGKEMAQKSKVSQLTNQVDLAEKKIATLEHHVTSAQTQVQSATQAVTQKEQSLQQTETAEQQATQTLSSAETNLQQAKQAVTSAEKETKIAKTTLDTISKTVQEQTAAIKKMKQPDPVIANIAKENVTPQKTAPAAAKPANVAAPAMQQTQAKQPKPIGIDLARLQKDLEKKLNISAKDAANLVQNVKVQPMQDWRKTPRAGPTTNVTITATPRAPGMR